MSSPKEIETEFAVLRRVPKKRNIAFEAIKSVLISVGVVFGIAAVRGKLSESLKGEELKTNIVYTSVFSCVSGAYNIYKAIRYNQEVDNYTQRLKQKQAAKAGGPARQ